MSVNRSQQISIIIILLLFLVVGVGGTTLAVIESRNTTKDTTAQTDTTDQSKCGGSKLDPVKRDVPEVYKTTGKVDTLEKVDLKVGDGQEVKQGDCIQVLYWGTIAQTGVKFDGNFDTGSPIEFNLTPGQLIQGWTDGIPGMKVGGVRRLVIPATQAYGEQSPSPAIPANSDLVFVVEILGVKK